MDPQSRPDFLRKRKEELLKVRKDLLLEQQRLIDEIRIKHPSFYSWTIQNQIDLTDVKTHAATIATAFAISLVNLSPITSLVDLPFIEPPSIPPTIETRVIEVKELQGLTEEQKGALVWARYGHLIRATAEKYDLDPDLIYATIMVESGGNTYAKRSEPQINDASYGLGQILYGTAKGIGFEGNAEKLYDPEINIDLIGKYHRRNQDHYGGNLTVDQLTTAYNSGNPYGYALPGHLSKFHKWYNNSSIRT